MKVRNVFWIGACLLAVSAAWLLLLWGQEEIAVVKEQTAPAEEQSARTQEQSASTEEQPAATEEAQVKQAEWMIPRYYDKIGARLTATLANEKQPIHQRVRAAKLLGEMKYSPAIPTLICYVGLLDPEVTAISSDWSLGLPCLAALFQFRNAAVPKVVEAFLGEENASRRYRLYSTIASYHTRRTALIYAKGLAAHDETKVHPKRLKELLKYLAQ